MKSQEEKNSVAIWSIVEWIAIVTQRDTCDVLKWKMQLSEIKSLAHFSIDIKFFFAFSLFLILLISLSLSSARLSLVSHSLLCTCMSGR